MAWYDTIIEAGSTVGSWGYGAAQWFWSKLPDMATTTVKYTANTGFQAAEEALASRTAIPALIYHQPSRNIMEGVLYVATWDVLPMVAVNSTNTVLQDYLASLGFYYPLLVIDVVVKGYTFKKGVDALMHTMVLDTLGPVAFKDAKSVPNPESVCTREHCTIQRFSTGYLRLPLTLLTNDLLTGAVSYIPYVGYPASALVSAVCWGRYIVGVATPERCEKHKYFMQEHVLALGTTYKLWQYFLDMALQRTIGLPPYMAYRALQHLLVLMHVNFAFHMRTPLIKQNNATLPVDPVQLYELSIRFITDTVIAGLIKQIPRYFPTDPNAPPLISMATVLQTGTRCFKSDLEQERVFEPVSRLGIRQKLNPLFVPIVFQGFRVLINDKIISMYWVSLRQGAMDILELALKAEHSKVVKTATWAPKSTARAIKLITGMPKKIAEDVLLMTREEDFWNFIHAVYEWFKRHDLDKPVTWVAMPERLMLNNESKVIALPKAPAEPVLKPTDLECSRVEPANVDAPVCLIPKVKQKHEVDVTAPQFLFSTKKRRDKKAVSDEQSTPEFKVTENYF